MNSKRFFQLIFFFIIFQSVTKAQNGDAILITPITNLGDIGWFYQFTFIHKTPKNKVDEWVKKIKLFGNYDSLQLVKLIDELAAIKSKESFSLLYIMCFQPMMIKHITAYNSFAGNIQYYGMGQRSLNKYYLNNVVNTKLSAEQFNSEVYKLCLKKKPICYYTK